MPSVWNCCSRHMLIVGDGELDSVVSCPFAGGVGVMWSVVLMRLEYDYFYLC